MDVEGCYIRATVGRGGEGRAAGEEDSEAEEGGGEGGVVLVGEYHYGVLSMEIGFLFRGRGGG